MTLHTPPSWLQNASHPAENDRLTTQALWASTGIVAPTSMAVTANSPVAMNVFVAAGWAVVVGDIQPQMGAYVFYNDDPVLLTITTANATNPRWDLIVATVNDSYYTGSTDNVVYQVIAGTPASSPVVPTTPQNSIALAKVYVGAAVLAINPADITDLRVSVTTNRPIGDITGVTAGTGLTGGGTSGAVTLAIDSTVATLSGTQALTNKDLTGTGNTFPSSLATLSGVQTLTNKTIDTANNTIIGLPSGNISINNQTGTTYTTVLADNQKLITLANASPITATIPPNASVNYPVGAQITFARTAAGATTIVGGSGVTIQSTGAIATAPVLRAQFSTATAIQTATNTWLVVGDIS
jgi:hypothetical protein